MDLVQAFMKWWQPWTRGLTPAGLATGMAATGGMFFPMIEGGHLLKRGTARDAIDQVVGAAGPRDRRITEFSWVGHAPATTYLYQIVPVGPGGVEAIVPAAGDQLLQVRTAEDGLPEEPAPAAARELSAAAVAGGKLRLVWMPGTGTRRPTAATYAIYTNNGAGDVDWSAPIATVPARPGRMHSWESDAFAHGATVVLGVRARTASGAEEINTATVSATADAEGPAAGAVATALIGGDE